ncbi:DUF5330 domain-containing protein [Ochrobactrum sp. CM-21-5]|nr:DUF5330 domain-containing protein [Ochrobactrum sp. CM-21-5]MBC2884722.1 DUF5330 domain-containing protein [Ochrobactrum sp. CM-21-5]
MIRFLLKSAFWLSLAFIVMPHFFSAEQEDKAPKQPAAAHAIDEQNSVDALLANGKTALEIGKLCMDNPSFCESGTSLIAKTGSEVLEGSRVMLDYLSNRFGSGTNTPAVQARPSATTAVAQKGAIPIPTSREDALRAIDKATTGAISGRAGHN